MKGIKKVYKCGGGAINGKFVDYIAIVFDDNEIKYIDNNLVDSVKKQVNAYIKTLKNEQKQTKKLKSMARLFYLSQPKDMANKKSVSEIFQQLRQMNKTKTNEIKRPKGIIG